MKEKIKKCKYLPPSLLKILSVASNMGRTVSGLINKKSNCSDKN